MNTDKSLLGAMINFACFIISNKIKYKSWIENLISILYGLQVQAAKNRILGNPQMFFELFYLNY